MSTKKIWFKSAFVQEFSQTEPMAKESFCASLSHSILETDGRSDIISKSGTNKFISSDWIEHFAPKRMSDLAVHGKKICEVREWLHNHERNRKEFAASILLVTGPAGSGKTATIRIVAKETGYEVIEWVTPVDIDLTCRIDGNTQVGEKTWSYVQSQVAAFRQFLFRSSRYKFQSPKRLVLVEDFPNTFVRNSVGFSDIFEDYNSYGKSPLIFVATDTKSTDLNLAFYLFPENICAKYRIAQIRFNSISAMLMKKGLQRICSLMLQEGYNKYYKVPSSDIIESINLSSQGDIRNAIINLYFASQKGAQKLETEPKKKTSSASRKKRKYLALKSITRDESITLMHVLGRVFNPKYIDDASPKKFLYTPETIVDSFCTEAKHFMNFIHSNYLAHFNEVKNAMKAADIISTSDVLMKEYRDYNIQTISLNIGVRGVMVNNSNPVAGWISVRGLRKKKCDSIFDTELNETGGTNGITRNVFSSDYRTYVKIIKM